MAEYFPGYGDEYTRPRVCSSRSSMALISKQRHRLAEYYFAPHELNIPANFPELFPANMCLKSLVPVPGKIPGHGTGLLHGAAFGPGYGTGT